MAPRGDLLRFYPYRSKRERDALKRLADKAVQKAVYDGTLLRQPCERCGRKRGVEAHHDDYAEPLQVRWFCRPHHRERDRELRRLRASGLAVSSLPAAVMARLDRQTAVKGALTLPESRDLVERATVALSDLMDSDGVNASALARRLAVSRQQVSVQFAGGFRTLSLLAKYADALGYEASVSFRKRESEAVAS